MKFAITLAILVAVSAVTGVRRPDYHASPPPRVLRTLVTETPPIVAPDLDTTVARLGEAVTRLQLASSRLNAELTQAFDGPVSPRRLLEGKVTAVANVFVSISIGRCDWVGEGDVFTVYRQGEYVARLVIARVGPRWAEGVCTHVRDLPRESDDVSNSVFLTD